MGRGALPQATWQKQGSRRGLEDQNPRALPQAPTPLAAPSPPTGRRESLPPLHGQLEFITTSPHPTPSPPHSLWSPLESRCGSQTHSFLKETSGRGRRWWDSTCPRGPGWLLCGASAGPHRSWPRSLEAPWVSPLGSWGLRDWGAGVNMVSGSWTRVSQACGGHRGGGGTP